MNERQRHGKNGSYPYLALNIYVAAVGPHHPRGEGQSQAHMIGAAARGVRLVEGLKEVGEMLGGDSPAGIAHFNYRASVLAPPD